MTKTSHTETFAVFDGITVTVHGGDMPLSEMEYYVKHFTGKYKNKRIESLDIRYVKNGGGYIDVDIKFRSVPFERIRRITGYLVGTLDRFNNAKRAEVGDRLKHDI